MVRSSFNYSDFDKKSIISNVKTRTNNHDQNLLDLGFTTDAAPYMDFNGIEDSEL